MNNKVVKEAIVELNKIIAKHEAHNDESKQLIAVALKELKIAAAEKKPKEKTITFDELMDNQANIILDRLITEGFTGVKQTLYLCYNSSVNWHITQEQLKKRKHKK